MDTQVIKTGKSEFETTRDFVGFEDAVVIFQDNIPASAREKFDIHHWVIVYKNVLSYSNIKKIAWHQISTTKADFPNWKRVFDDSFGHKALRTFALKRMLKLADNLEELVFCINHLEASSQEQEEALKKLSTMEASFDSWMSIWRSNSGRIERVAFDKMKKIEEATFFQWELASRETKFDSNYGKESLAEMMKRAKTFDEWLKVYQALRRPGELKEKALKEAANAAEGPYDLGIVYLNTSDLGSKKTIQARLLKAKGDFDDWVQVNQFVEMDDPLKKISLDKMKELATTCLEWSVIFHRTSDEKEKETAALNMIELARDMGEAKLAYYKAPTPALSQKAIAKMKELVSAKIASAE